jgi:excisionase family DNA binding protein
MHYRGFGIGGGPMTTEPAVYRAEEVAELLGTTPRRVYEMVRQERIPYVRLGERSLRFPRQAIRRWLDGQAADGVESGARMAH